MTTLTYKFGYCSGARFVEKYQGLVNVEIERCGIEFESVAMCWLYRNVTTMHIKVGMVHVDSWDPLCLGPKMGSKRVFLLVCMGWTFYIEANDARGCSQRPYVLIPGAYSIRDDGVGTGYGDF